MLVFGGVYLKEGHFSVTHGPGDVPSVQFLPQFLGLPQHGRLGLKLHVCHPEMPHGHSICHLHRGYQRLHGWCIYLQWMVDFLCFHVGKYTVRPMEHLGPLKKGKRFQQKERVNLRFALFFQGIIFLSSRGSIYLHLPCKNDTNVQLGIQ